MTSTAGLSLLDPSAVFGSSLPGGRTSRSNSMTSTRRRLAWTNLWCFAITILRCAMWRTTTVHGPRMVGPFSFDEPANQTRFSLGFWNACGPCCKCRWKRNFRCNYAIDAAQSLDAFAIFESHANPDTFKIGLAPLLRSHVVLANTFYATDGIAIWLRQGWVGSAQNSFDGKVRCRIFRVTVTGPLKQLVLWRLRQRFLRMCVLRSTPTTTGLLQIR